MIITNAILLHSITTVLTFGSNSNDLTPRTLSHFVRGYTIMEKIQMVGFWLQEFILSIIYIRETVRLLKLSGSVRDDVQSFDDRTESGTLKNASVRKTMYQLLAINVIIIIMDLALLGVEFANLYLIETTLKGVVYSIKLKLEFAVLGKLVQLVRDRASSLENSDQNVHSSPSRRGTSTGLKLQTTNSLVSPIGTHRMNGSPLNHDFGSQNYPEFVNPSSINTDVTHAEQANGDAGWETRADEEGEKWRRRKRVLSESWIDEEMDRHNIG